MKRTNRLGIACFAMIWTINGLAVSAADPSSQHTTRDQTS